MGYTIAASKLPTNRPYQLKQIAQSDMVLYDQVSSITLWKIVAVQVEKLDEKQVIIVRRPVGLVFIYSFVDLRYGMQDHFLMV